MGLKRKLLSFFAAVIMIVGPASLASSSAFAATTENEPEHTKQLIDNGDGTYTVKLSVTGEAKTDVEIKQTNVVIVYDTSGSMVTDNVYEENNNGTWGYYRGAYYESSNDGNFVRLYKGQSVANRLSGSGTYEGTVYVRTGLRSYVEYTGQRYENTRTNSHTRASLAEEELSNLETTLSSMPGVNIYRIVFSNDARTVTSFSNISYDGATNWEAALRLANNTGNTVDENGNKVPKVVIFISDGDPYPASFFQSADDVYNGAVVEAKKIINNGDALFGIGAFGDVSRMQSLINEAGGTTYYSASDSESLNSALNNIAESIETKIEVVKATITDGITASTSIAVSGATSDFSYVVPEGATAGEAEFKDGQVVWSVENLKDGQTAEVSFIVWPSQEAFDSIADKENEVNDSLSRGVAASDNGYTLSTNEDYPLTNLTYTTKTTISAHGNSSSETSTGTTEFNRVNPISLINTKLNISKLWKDGLDGGEQRREDFQDGITLNLEKDGEVVETYNFAYSDGEKWIDSEKTSYTVAPGVMVEIGNDASSVSPLETYAINSGKEIVEVNGKRYAILEAGHDYEFIEDKAEHFVLTKYKYHPMVVNGKLKNLVYDKSGNLKTIEDFSDDGMYAENSIKGGINIQKTVRDNSGNTIDINGEGIANNFVKSSIFNVRVTLQNEDGSDYGAFKYNLYNREGEKTKGESSAGVKVFTLQVGEIVRIIDVEEGVKYKVEELDANGTPIKDSLTYDLYNIGYDISEGSSNNASDYQTENDGFAVAKNNSAMGVKVENTYNSGKVTVSKKVVIENGNAELFEGKEYNFRFEAFSDEARETKIFEEEFALKDAESKEFELPSGAYYTVDEFEKEAGELSGFTVSLEDGSDEKEGRVDKDTEREIKFLNTYSVSPSIAKIAVSKEFNLWHGNEFEFELKEENKKSYFKTVSEREKTAEFTIDITTPGTRTFIVHENTKNLGEGISNENNDLEVTIVAEDNGDGTLKVNPPVYTNGSTIRNIYSSAGSAEIKFEKLISGREWLEGETFQFSLLDEDENILGSVEASEGKDVVFDKLEYKTEDGGKTYYYIIREISEKAGFVKAQDLEVAVEVVENYDGTLSTKIKYDGEETEKGTIINQYIIQEEETPEEVSGGKGGEALEVAPNTIDHGTVGFYALLTIALFGIAFSTVYGKLGNYEQKVQSKQAGAVRAGKVLGRRKS